MTEVPTSDPMDLAARLRARPDAADELVPQLYEQLRRVAASRLRRADHAVGLHPTELVHEAYLRMADQSGLDAAARSRFFAVSAQVIRNVLVDAARRRGAAKRGGGIADVPLGEDEPHPGRAPIDVLALDEALARLAALDARQAQVVELRFFGGLTCEEVAEVLGLSRRTVQADWSMARTWLRRALE